MLWVISFDSGETSIYAKLFMGHDESIQEHKLKGVDGLFSMWIENIENLLNCSPLG